MSKTEQTIKALVVDDEPLARDELIFLLEQCGGIEVIGQAGEASAAMRLAKEHSPEVAFLDLRMPGPDGLALADALLGERPSLAIVVISAHDEGALRGFEVGISDYLLKPVRLGRLKKSLERVRAKVAAATAVEKEVSVEEGEAPLLTRLAVRRRNAYVVVDLAEVIYFETRDELVWAVTKDDRYALDLTLSNLEKRVPEGFFRSHRGALVRLDRIIGIEPAGSGTFTLRLDHPEDPRLPLARERARLLREIIPVAG